MARVNRFILVSAILSALLSVRAYAHNLHGEDGHYDRSVKPPLLESRQTNQTEKKRLARRVTTRSSSAEKAAAQIYGAIRAKKKVAYITSRWAVVALLMKIMPDFLFKKL